MLSCAERLPNPPRGEPGTPGRLDRIYEALRGLRHGRVTIIVQDGIIIQVERTEKIRLPTR